MNFNRNKLKILDLFSGIGGFSIGLENSGMETIAFCEIEKYPKKILSKHWPTIPIYEDIRKLDGYSFNDKIDILCGGFPCQDISLTGKQKGLNGNHSSLWYEFKRLINEVKPKYAIIENVANLRSRGLVSILQDLWEIGYDAEWNIISAGELGYPHLRERIWIIAYPHSTQLKRGGISSRIQSKVSDLSNIRRGKDKPRVERTSNGIPSQMDRLKCLGNALIPLIPNLIGEAILEERSDEFQ